jgi:hypothetical protein
MLEFGFTGDRKAKEGGDDRSREVRAYVDERFEQVSQVAESHTV